MIVCALCLIIFLSAVVVCVYKQGYADGIRDGRAENYLIFGDRRKNGQKESKK